MSFAYTPIILSSQIIGLVGGAGAGGAGIGVTVGPSGGSYQSVADAAAAGQSVVHIINNTVESGAVVVTSSGMIVHLYYGYTWNLQNNQVSVPTNSILQIDGNGEVQYGDPPGGVVFNGSGSLVIENVQITNASQGFTPCFTNMDYVRMANVLYDGDCRICGDYNIYSDSIYRSGQLIVDSGNFNNHIAGAIFQTYAVVNSGSNNIFSDILGV
jgi:hypothetical protein